METFDHVLPYLYFTKGKQVLFNNNNNNLLIGCSITRVVYIEVLITRCILYNTIKI